MMSRTAKLCCADITLQWAAELFAKRESIPPIEALQLLIASKVYDMLYDPDTLLWCDGPAAVVGWYDVINRK